MIAERVLEGAQVRLRPVQEADLPRFVEWLNDPEVRRWLAISELPLLTMEAEREWHARAREDPSSIVWCIEAQGRAIGTLGLHRIDRAHGRAELGIFIGDKGLWSRGLGTAAIRQILRHAFEQMTLRRVELHVDEDNLRGIRCYEKCGFVREGLLRSFRLREGAPLSCFVMGILREEYEEEPWR